MESQNYININVWAGIGGHQTRSRANTSRDCFSNSVYYCSPALFVCQSLAVHYVLDGVVHSVHDRRRFVEVGNLREVSVTVVALLLALLFGRHARHVDARADEHGAHLGYRLPLEGRSRRNVARGRQLRVEVVELFFVPVLVVVRDLSVTSGVAAPATAHAVDVALVQVAADDVHFRRVAETVTVEGEKQTHNGIEMILITAAQL